MSRNHEELLDALSLAYRLKGQAASDRQESALLLEAILAVLRAPTLEDMYQQLFDAFSSLIDYELAFVLEQKGPGRMVCSSGSGAGLVGSEWKVDSVLKRAVLGEPCAVYAVDRQPAWQAHLDQTDPVMRSALYCPFNGPSVNAVLVLCHSERGHYVQHHVQMATRYKSFVEQALLGVHAKLLALESQQLRVEKERFQENLVQSEKMASLGLLAAGVAHEINNPVGYVSSNVKYLADNVDSLQSLQQRFAELNRCVMTGDLERAQQLAQDNVQWSAQQDVPLLVEDFKEVVADCGDGLGRVRDILEQLRRFSRADSEETAEIDVNDCVESTLKLVHNELKYRCELDVQLGAVEPVQGNEGKFNQVLLNLLVNAGQAIDEKGVIRVRSGTVAHPVVGRCSWLSVEDNGCGIAPDAINKVFDPFFTTKSVNDGTGLGLSISYSTIEGMGGNIEVESELNRFTRFTVYVPVFAF